MPQRRFGKFGILLALALLGAGLAFAPTSASQRQPLDESPELQASATAFVQLFAWPWADVARECETFLGPQGFSAVEVSAPNASITGADGLLALSAATGYEIRDRAGFLEMVQRCRDAGVRVYVDAIRDPAQDREAFVNYLDALLDLGVAGFRLHDAGALGPEAVVELLDDVRGEPYVYQAVVDLDDDAATALAHAEFADVTDFRRSLAVNRLFRQGPLAALYSSGVVSPSVPGERAVVFVDSPALQREALGDEPLTFRERALYELANVFLLAWPQGYPRVMSSYDFFDVAQGPPAGEDGALLPVHDAEGTLNCGTPLDGTEGRGWVCEHRWPGIASMVTFRRASAPVPEVTHWWDDGADQIAFGRGDRGFVVINRGRYPLRRTFQTGLAAGIYCNVLDGALTEDGRGCTGTRVFVGADGTAALAVKTLHALALHIGARVRTVEVTLDLTGVYLRPGQQVYVMGNVASLGSWDPCAAVPLARVPGDYRTWRARVALPASALITYTYVKAYDGACEEATRERGPNRFLITSRVGRELRSDALRALREDAAYVKCVGEDGAAPRCAQ